MPDSDMSHASVVVPDSGRVMTPRSWVIGRLLRDMKLQREKAEKEEQEALESRPSGELEPRAQPWVALTVSVFEIIDNPVPGHGIPKLDWVWFLGFGVILVQLAISIIPWVINAEWGTFIVTICGNLFAILGASLPQWREEKWACPKHGSKTIALTEGNGSRDVMVILGKRGVGLDLEVLTSNRISQRSPPSTKIAILTLAALWTVLLITVAGLTLNSWCRLFTFE